MADDLSASDPATALEQVATGVTASAVRCAMLALQAAGSASMNRPAFVFTRKETSNQTRVSDPKRKQAPQMQSTSAARRTTKSTKANRTARRTRSGAEARAKEAARTLRALADDLDARPVESGGLTVQGRLVAVLCDLVHGDDAENTGIVIEVPGDAARARTARQLSGAPGTTIEAPSALAVGGAFVLGKRSRHAKVTKTF